jgi:hypothetical protein
VLVAHNCGPSLHCRHVGASKDRRVTLRQGGMGTPRDVARPEYESVEGQPWVRDVRDMQKVTQVPGIELSSY